MPRIRSATTADCEDTRAVYLSAFPESERALVAALAVKLLDEETNPPTVSLVAEVDDTLVGHIAFSPVSAESGRELSGYLLAPLAVRPQFQGCRIGSKLIATGKDQLSAAGVDIIFVYGDPQYYGRFGFSADTARGYLPPYELTYPFGWQAMALNELERARSAATLSCVASLRNPDLW